MPPPCLASPPGSALSPLLSMPSGVPHGQARREWEEAAEPAGLHHEPRHEHDDAELRHDDSDREDEAVAARIVVEHHLDRRVR